MKGKQICLPIQGEQCDIPSVYQIVMQCVGNTSNH
jgi:hypothetical protein